MLQRARANEDITSAAVVGGYRDADLGAAINNFAHYRVLMNPRFTLKKKWFPRSLAQTLRQFYDDFKVGKRPVLLETITGSTPIYQREGESDEAGLVCRIDPALELRLRICAGNL